MGSVKKIYIIHGWSYSVNNWQPTIKLLREKGFMPVMLNVPGLTAKNNKVWTLDEYVEWLKNQIGDQKIILIGNSNGGRISLAFAAKYPQKLKYLILVDSAGIYHNELPIRLKRLVFGTVAKLGKKLSNSEKLRSLIYKLARESDYKNATPQMRQTMINMISVDLTPHLRKIITPTLIIWGKLDKITPLSDGKLMHELIKNSKLEIIADAGHSPYFTHPEQVVKKITSEVNKL